MSFTQFILSNQENKKILISSAIIIVLQLAIFKYFYPYPNFIPESGSYIEAAINNQLINILPIGYSIFLRLFSCFTTSHSALVGFQYLLLQASILYFLFTVNYLVHQSKWMFRILIVISILNPLLLHISNFISSDAPLIALSFVWLTQLIWIIYSPTFKLLLFHSVVILLIVMTWHNTLHYPLLSVLAIWLTSLTNKDKKLGISLILLLLLIFIGRTQYEYQQKTDTVQISAFAGWQIAANAIYAYSHTQPISPNNVPKYISDLHYIVNEHIDSLKQLRDRPDKESSIYYLLNKKSPLQFYMRRRFQFDSSTNMFEQWAKMAPIYSHYGWHLIQMYPDAFIQYYLWPNLVKYFLPPAGYMGSYNREEQIANPALTKWFGWTNNKLHKRFNNNSFKINEYFSILTISINVIFLLSWLSFICLIRYKQSTIFRNGVIWWMALLWLSNISVSILAPIELRFQIFPTITGVVFSAILISWIIHQDQSVVKINQK